MPSLLAVLTSPRGDYSVSRALTAQFVDQWKKEHGGEVVTRDLCKTKLPFVDLPWIAGAYTPAEQHSPEMTEALAISNELIAELQAADHIVIGTNMYNFNVPANLKAWIDHIVRFNVTFNASYEGLLKGKKATIIQVSGGLYNPGAQAESYNYETGYLKFILGFIGITDVNVIMAGGTADIDRGVAPFAEVVAKYTPEVTAAAS
jgi:FMN-dependent NADH-azoreductase